MADVKVIREFRDKTEGLKLRKKDEVLKVSEERAKYLEELNLVERIQKEKKETEKKG